MPTMKRPYQLTALVLFFLSGVIAYESLQLKYYTTLGPGPGFFPLWLSLALAALAVAMFYQSTFRDSGPRPADFWDSKKGYLRAFAMCIAWIWATVMLERLGYRLTMLVFFPLLLLTLGRVRWWAVILISLLGSVAAFYVFSLGLSVHLPVGPFDGIFEAIDDRVF
ncbi:MAG TPA: tripartite tricarboxylate transporter TctB family protein [Desulfobacterales bacterium]|nr:tripartite tricarboxylate transporter TctB family protein [Desulfobacterales bacterium]